MEAAWNNTAVISLQEEWEGGGLKRRAAGPPLVHVSTFWIGFIHHRFSHTLCYSNRNRKDHDQNSSRGTINATLL